MERLHDQPAGIPVVILLLGGTSESREAARLFVENGYEVLYTSTTGIISDLPAAVIHTVGALDEASFKDLLKRYPVRCIVDATHPFATVIKTLATRVAGEAGIPCIRLKRGGDEPHPDDPSVIVVDSLRQAVESMVTIPGGILSTIGTRMLPQLCEELGERRRDLAVRVLPVAASFTECEKCGIHPSRIVAMQGPFDKAFNRWCIERFSAATMLTKESGDRGGFGEKVEACRETGCRLVVIRRPVTGTVTMCESAKRCLEMFGTMGL